MAGIQTSLRKIMGLDFTSAPTLEQIIYGLQQAKKLSIVQNTKWLLTTIDAILISFQVIYIVQEVIAIIKQLKPILNLISKIFAAAAPPPNVGMISEIISDLIETIISTIKGLVNTIIDKVIETILDYEFTIDIPAPSTT